MGVTMQYKSICIAFIAVLALVSLSSSAQALATSTGGTGSGSNKAVVTMADLKAQFDAQIPIAMNHDLPKVQREAAQNKMKALTTKMEQLQQQQQQGSGQGSSGSGN